MYIYIERERERERDVYVSLSLSLSIYIYIYVYPSWPPVHAPPCETLFSARGSNCAKCRSSLWSPWHPFRAGGWDKIYYRPGTTQT